METNREIQTEKNNSIIDKDNAKEKEYINFENINKDVENIKDIDKTHLLYVIYSAIFESSEIKKNEEEIVYSEKKLKSNNLPTSSTGKNKSSELKPKKEIKINKMPKLDSNKKRINNKKSAFKKINFNGFYLLDEYSSIKDIQIDNKKLENDDDYIGAYLTNDKKKKLEFYEKEKIKEKYYFISIFNKYKEENKSYQKEYKLLFPFYKYSKTINEKTILDAIKKCWFCEYFKEEFKINLDNINLSKINNDDMKYDIVANYEIKSNNNNILNTNCNGNNIINNNNNGINNININTNYNNNNTDNNNNNYKNKNFNNNNNSINNFNNSYNHNYNNYNICNNNNNNYHNNLNISNNNNNNNYSNNENSNNYNNNSNNNYNNTNSNNNCYNNNYNYNNTNPNNGYYNNNNNYNKTNSNNNCYNNNNNSNNNYYNNNNNLNNDSSNNNYYNYNSNKICNNNNENNNYYNNNNNSNNNNNNNNNYPNNYNVNSYRNNNNNNSNINYYNNSNNNQNNNNSINNNNYSNNMNIYNTNSDKNYYNNNTNNNYNNNINNCNYNNSNNIYNINTNNNTKNNTNNNAIIINQINNKNLNSKNLNNNASNYYNNSNINNNNSNQINNNKNIINYNKTTIMSKVNINKNKNNSNNNQINIIDENDYYNDNDNKNYNDNYNENKGNFKDDISSSMSPSTVILPKKKTKENINISFFFPLVGLNNVGSTCFMNATLQCLLHVSELSLYFLKEFPNDRQALRKKNSSSESHGNISEAYYNLVNSVYEQDKKEISKNYFFFAYSKNKSFPPKEFKQTLGFYNPQFKYNEANDSKDLILYLLQTFHEELNYMGDQPFPTYLMRPDQLNRASSFNYFMQTYNFQNFSIASKLFFGTYENRTMCCRCQNLFYSFQKFEFISFPTHKYTGKTFNILDGFKDNREIQDLTGDNQYFCQICQAFCNGKICCSIIQPPSKLVINIDYGVNKRFKVKNLIFEEIIDITEYINFDFGKRIKYQILGICTHLGSSGSSGHYIAFCRNKSNGRWYNFNDSSCSESDKNTAFSYGNPYLLIYEQI